MLRKGHYRQVFEMGQEGQEKPESVSGVEVWGTFQILVPHIPQKARRV
jgi:hypothetical protein